MLSDDKYSSDKEPSSPTEEDLENFMTLDSVGDVDGKCSEGKLTTLIQATKIHVTK